MYGIPGTVEDLLASVCNRCNIHKMVGWRRLTKYAKLESSTGTLVSSHGIVSFYAVTVLTELHKMARVSRELQVVFIKLSPPSKNLLVKAPFKGTT